MALYHILDNWKRVAREKFYEQNNGPRVESVATPGLIRELICLNTYKSNVWYRRLV